MEQTCDNCEHKNDSSDEYCGVCDGSNWKEAGWHIKERLETENKRLKDALLEYGEHSEGCKTYFIDMSVDRTGNTFYKECDCGFEQALKGIK